MSTVVLALDSFKGSITAADACSALAGGWRSERPGTTIVCRPMADGGEGTLSAFAAAVPGARRMPVTVTGPDRAPTNAAWLLLPPTPDAPRGTAVVELASTSGIELLGDRRLPWDAGTEGFGQAIVAALDQGISRLVLGIGSSASTDGGAGVLTALGARFRDAAGEPVPPGLRGLAELVSVELSGLRGVPASGVRVLTDVTNPLLGPNGAAAIFGPQKGLEQSELPAADRILARFAAQLRAAVVAGGADARAADPAQPGAGAAGGTGFALRVWGGQLVSGAAEVAELIGLREALAEAAVIVVGEGAYDEQSATGKSPAHIAALAADHGVPVAVVAGRIAPTADTSKLVAAVSLSELAGSSAAALAEPARWLDAAGARLAEQLGG